MKPRKPLPPRSAPLRRSLNPLPQPRKPIARFSVKRRRLLAQRRVAVQIAMDRAGGRCEASGMGPISCAGPLDPHEPLTRARGGSIVDPEAIAMICRAHHEWAHRQPIAATELGLLIPSWERQ